MTLIVLLCRRRASKDLRPSSSLALSLPTLIVLVENSATEPLQPAVPAGQETLIEATPLLDLGGLGERRRAGGRSRRGRGGRRAVDGLDVGRDRVDVARRRWPCRCPRRRRRSRPTPSRMSSVSLPSPPSRTSLPAPPLRVSLPAPPSATTGIVTPGVIVSVSLPPNVLSSKTSAWPMLRLNGGVGAVVADAAVLDLERRHVVAGAEVVLDRVEAGVAVHDVVAVAVVPDERVVAAAAVERVVAAVADDAVAAAVAGRDRAVDHAGPRGRCVVARAGVDVHRRRRRPSVSLPEKDVSDSFSISLESTLKAPALDAVEAA